MAKKATKKGNGTKRDLTGKKPGKPTKADIRNAAAAIAVADKKDVILKVSAAVTGLRAQQKSIGEQIQAEREKLQAIGITKAGFDWAMRLIKMDPDDRQDTLDALGLTLEANGLGRQDDLFAAGAEGSNDAFDQNDNADRAGFQAASEGQNFDMNPHAPETPEHEAWSAGWMRQQTQHAASLGPDSATAH